MEPTDKLMICRVGTDPPRRGKLWPLFVALLLVPTICGQVQQVAAAQEPKLVPHPLAPKEAYEEKINLLLLHGWNVNGNDRIGLWNDLVKAIANDNDLRYKYRPYCVVYDHARPVAENGKRLGELLQGVRNPLLPLVLVGHSTGGLVARVFLQRFDPDQPPESKQYEPLREPRILKLITLATPHHGTPLSVVDWLRKWSRIDECDWLINQIVKDNRIPAETPGGSCLAWDNCDGKIPDKVREMIEKKRQPLPALFHFTETLNRDLTQWLAANPGFCSNWILYGGFHTWEPRLGIPKSLLTAYHQSEEFWQPFTRALLVDGLHDQAHNRCRYPGDGIVPLESALLLKLDSREVKGRETGEFLPGITVSPSAKHQQPGFMVEVDGSRLQKFDANMDLRVVRDVFHTYLRDKPVVVYRVLEDLRTAARDWERAQTPVPTETLEPTP